MTKYCFSATHYDNTKITVEFEADTISKTLENIELFLRGVGFYTEGTLDFVTDELPSDDKCSICGLTDEQLGMHACFDKNCPKMENLIHANKR
jgi:hypothetical protein